MQKEVSTSFVDAFEPADDALVELRNGRFVDVVNGRYFPAGVKVVVQGQRIKAMPGLPGEPKDIVPHFIVDLNGRAVFPGLFNTHSHVSLFSISLAASFGQTRLAKKHRDQQILRNLINNCGLEVQRAASRRAAGDVD